LLLAVTIQSGADGESVGSQELEREFVSFRADRVTQTSLSLPFNLNCRFD